MSVLNLNPVLQSHTSVFQDEAFTGMYFGRHCGKNLLFLKHHLTLMVVCGTDLRSTPEYVKTVSFRGDTPKVVKIVGNENVILLLDDGGNLWKLIDTSEISENEGLHSLNVNCFLQWVPFRKFNSKVLAITEFGSAFACVILCRNSERKLVVLSSIDSVPEDYTFEGLSTENSFSYYLKNISINTCNSVYKSLSPASEILLLGDRFTGKLYLCSKQGRNVLINHSDIFLVSVLHFEEEKCLLICYKTGKLVFSFYNESKSNYVMYLSEGVHCIEKCCCTDSCILWSDGIKLKHTKLMFQSGERSVRPSHLKVNCSIEFPISILKICKNVLVVSINRIYYYITPGVIDALEIWKEPQEVLSEIYNGSCKIGELQDKIDMLSYYLQCKETVQKSKAKIEISWEGSKLLLKGCAGDFLRGFWKVKLTTKSEQDKNLVQMVDLESDLKKGTLIAIENPFKSKNKIKVSLVGDFHGNELFVDLGELGESQADAGTSQLCKHLKEILAKRNPYVKHSQ